MKDHVTARAGYFDPDACDISEFEDLIGQQTRSTDVPMAAGIQKSIPIYDMARLRASLDNRLARRDLMAEWAATLGKGAGVVVLKSAYADTRVLDEATAIYDDIIASEKQANVGGGDHFAASGANDRIWNSLQKLCEANAEVFLRYFANTAISAACEAWLGPNYQMTAQINLVHPGGAAQEAHRDYHLGFQSAAVAAEYPAHVHDLSPAMTLQGGIAHCDMPIESGPTKLLPYSQGFRPGYLAFRQKEFREMFEARCVQLPLAKGDAVFFNPALFHAAGHNQSKDIHRMVNLLQISSPFGRAMEAVDRTGMCGLLYPHARAALAEGTLSASEIGAAIAATAEGYAFPTNLDLDPPVGGLAPESQAAYFARALEGDISAEAFAAHLDMMDARQLA